MIGSVVYSITQKAKHSISFLWRKDEGRLVSHLIKLFKATPFDLVVDVGANRGRYIEIMRACVGYRGEIIAVEPIPHNIDLLRAVARHDKSLTIEPTLLGRMAGEYKLNITEHDAMSSVYIPKNIDGSDLSTLNQVVSEITVPCRTLDSVLAEGSNVSAASNIFLKLDAQGSDLDILAGGRDVLARVGAIQIEVPFVPLYEGLPPASQYFERLEHYGYTLTGAFPVHRLKDQRVVDVDAVFIKNQR